MGESVGQRYELETKVREGPLATVWRGIARGEHGFTRPVAIRDLHRSLTKDRRFVGSWVATLAELAQSPSPHLEQVLDVVAEGDRVLVVSEWIDGVSLGRWIEAHRGAVPWPLALEVAIELLRGLMDAHARPTALCHDGISPRAVRIARDGTVKLMRFGVAGALAATGMGRRRMEELGLRHAAPEIVAGEGTTPMTDQFGIGALMFEMLASEPAFDAPVGEARDRLVTGEPPDLADARPTLPPLVVALVERAMRKDPVERFASAAGMARALVQVLRSHPEPTGPEVLAASLEQVDVRALEREATARLELAREVFEERLNRTSAGPPRRKAARRKELPSGPPALAASVQDILKPGSKRPQGLVATAQHTMHVDPEELREVLERVEGAPATVAEILDSERPPANEAGERAPDGSEDAEKPRRYRFDRRERTASASARALRANRAPKDVPSQNARVADSGAASVPLKTSRDPGGLSPAQTEFLDEDQVDQLTVAEEPRSEQPAGLQLARTEFLDEDQVDQLTVDDG